MNHSQVCCVIPRFRARVNPLVNTYLRCRYPAITFTAGLGKCGKPERHHTGLVQSTEATLKIRISLLVTHTQAACCSQIQCS